ncbi:MAG: hypothetical protein O9341_16780 [Paucibacter sp.]|nr:hypothetical protein [Roseateles sp.]
MASPVEDPTKPTAPAGADLAACAHSKPRRQLLKTLSLAGGLAWPALGHAAPASGAGRHNDWVIRHEMRRAADGTPSLELAVLHLLLSKTEASHGPFRLETMPPRENLTQSRQMLDLRIGALDLMATMTSKAREPDGIPVHTCMRRGLNGLRLPIALASRRRELEEVRSLEQVRQLRVAQVAHWPDASVMRANGMTVLPIPRLDVFEAMLKRDRFDLFALAADEAFGIVNALPGVVVLSDWLLAYPSTFSFIVNHARPELAERLRQGWRVVQADGSFEALHEKLVGAEVAQAQLGSRRWLSLSNPELPPAALRQDGRLWHPLVRQRVIAPLLR